MTREQWRLLTDGASAWFRAVEVIDGATRAVVAAEVAAVDHAMRALFEHLEAIHELDELVGD